MKGVIVQVGDPKSIVLLNNGKIMAITSPEGATVGMIVTIQNNDLFKTLLITLCALLLVTVGIIIGAQFFGSRSRAAQDWENRPPYEQPMHQRMHGRGRMMNPNW